jgi:DNA-binding SARP family transcriptional activator
MAKEAEIPEPAHSHPSTYEDIAELLREERYDRAAQRLTPQTASGGRREQAALLHILEAARSVILARDQSRAEIAWYRRLLAESEERTQELTEQLDALLRLVTEESVPRTERVGNSRPIPQLRRNLWLRIKSWLGGAVIDLDQPARKETHVPSPPHLATENEPAPDSDYDRDAPLVFASPDLSQEGDAPSLVIYCLGAFRVYQDDEPVTDWPSSKGQSIFKYLVTNHGHTIPKEVLMDVFWPDMDPDAARNNLNVAIYGLRQALRQRRSDYSHVLYQEGRYLLNPDMPLWTDVETFERLIDSGRKQAAASNYDREVHEYRAAEALYGGDFLEEDIYEDWATSERDRLREGYLTILERLSRYYFDRTDHGTCAVFCRKALDVDPCRERAHRLLMRSYVEQGQSYLALRQYHLCAEKLREELDVSPSEETTFLYQDIQAARSLRDT